MFDLVNVYQTDVEYQIIKNLFEENMQGDLIIKENFEDLNDMKKRCNSPNGLILMTLEKDDAKVILKKTSALLKVFEKNENFSKIVIDNKPMSEIIKEKNMKIFVGGLKNIERMFSLVVEDRVFE